MTEWIFTLYDYTFDPAGEAYVLDDEPQGWADLENSLKRDTISHGVNMDQSLNELTFHGEAMDVIATAYDINGIAAKVEIEIEEICEGKPFVTLRSRLDFMVYRRVCDDGCSVEISLEKAGCFNDFLTRMEQKVDLDSLKSFGSDTDDLTPYDRLGFNLTLPSKAIQNTTNYQPSQDTLIIDGSMNVGQIPPNELNYAFEAYRFIQLGFDEMVLDEIGDFQSGTGVVGYFVADDVAPVFIAEKAGTYRMRVNVDLQYCGKMVTEAQLLGATCPGGTYGFDGYELRLRLFKTATGAWISGTELDFATGSEGRHDCDDSVVYCNDIALDYDSNNGVLPFTLDAGDEIRVYLQVRYFGTYANPTVVPKNVFVTDSTTLRRNGSSFDINTITTYPDSITRAYMMNEVISRIAESTTGGCLRLQSDYFGRTDSQPFTASADGCGALEIITSGLQIRQATIQGNQPMIAVSFKEVFDAMKSVHNIGYHFDEVNNRIRMESMEYFYKDVEIFRATDIETLEIRVDAQALFNTFKFGYSKYEAEEFNGLDEFLTEREYRNNVTVARQTLDQTCKFIASGYAIEVTRRKASLANASSADSSFDNDIFLICVKRSGSNYQVEFGNITSPVNIFEPNSIYNYRISPVRNAMRWLKYILYLYKDPFQPASQYLFTNGKGNFYAEGEMDSATCRLEGGPVAENATLDVNMLDDFSNGVPLFTPEIVEFEYPMSLKEFDDIKQDPHGYITYECGGNTGEGFILDLVHLPGRGTAKFTLRPKR